MTRTKQGIEITAVGEKAEETREGKAETSVWRTVRPAFLYGGTLGDRYKQESLKIEGLPEVISSGDAGGLGTGNMVGNVAVDIVKSLDFYT